MILNEFAKMISTFAIKANNEINRGETLDVNSISDSNLENLLQHSIMFKDNDNEIWFSTTNPEIIHFVTEAYFGKNKEILKKLNKSMNKDEIAKKTNLSRTTAYRKIDELIEFGFIVKNKQKRSQCTIRSPTFCKLFDKLEYVESTKISNMKFCVNKDILKKGFWRNDV